MKGKLLIVGSIFIVCLSALILIRSETEKNASKKNGFDRKWLSKGLVLLNSIKTKDAMSTISGHTASHIYLATKEPGKIIETPISLSKITTYHLPYAGKTDLYQLFTTLVDSPDVIILCNKDHKVLYGSIMKSQINSKTLSCPSFIKAIFLNKQNFVTRWLDTSNWDMQIQKVNITNDSFFAGDSLLPIRKNNAGFNTDGNLSFDLLTKMVSYVNFYNNQFLVFDTSLRLKYKGYTIDTCNTSNISVTTFDNGHVKRFMNNNPPRQVNDYSFSYNGFLYVRSNLKADNESPATFKNNFVFDKYDLMSGKYVGSIYIPKKYNESFVDIKVIDSGVCVVLFRHNITTYKFIQ